MAQIFSPRAGLYGWIVLALLLGAAVTAVLAWRGLTAAPFAIDEPVPQPVPFSHKHHVGDDGIDCRYCHASVETEAFAGIPPISTCMTCHSQLFTDQTLLAPVVTSWESGVPLRWQRVNALPDFVFFNHSVHVAKGVGCVTCHGRVDRMPLTWRAHSLSMAWCLDCHRNPAPKLRPREAVFDMAWTNSDPERLGTHLMHQYRIDTSTLAECSTCHR
jgi:hypothetical protein